MNKEEISVLISDDTAENGVRVASQLREYGLYAITRRKDGNAVYEAIVRNRPDVVVADLSLPNLDAVALMKKCRETLDEVPKFIIISNVMNNFIERQVIENGASYYIVSPFEVEDLSSVIKSLVCRDTDDDCTDMEIVVTDVIHKLGIPAHIKGYHYLRTAILESIDNRELMDCITKRLYPSVAEKYTTTPSRVERAIRHAIDVAWNRCDENILNSFFGCTVDIYRGKPTNSEFIALVSDKLRLRRKTASHDRKHTQSLTPCQSQIRIA